jgi:hypothetical protein
VVRKGAHWSTNNVERAKHLLEGWREANLKQQAADPQLTATSAAVNSARSKAKRNMTSSKESLKCYYFFFFLGGLCY